MSTRSVPGKTIEDLVHGGPQDVPFKNGSVGISAIQIVEAAGGHIQLDGGPFSYHATLYDLTVDQAPSVFISVPNIWR
jgi:hypothetical protein